VTVRDHLKDYPAGLPRPQVDPAPVYECGSRTRVNNLVVGCTVLITANGAEVGKVAGANQHQGVNVNPDYGPAQEVRAQAELCGDPSPLSARQDTQPPPKPLPTPGFEPIYAGGTQLTITNLANGARFDLSRNGVGLGTWRTWGVRHLVGVNPPFSVGDVFTCVQRLCPGDPDSPPGTTPPVQPCSALPAPLPAPIQDGDTVITLLSFVPDATVRVYLNLVKIGEGSGPVVALTKAVRDGDLVHVLQDLQGCTGSTAFETHSQCVAPPDGGNPAGLDLFPVGFTEYDGGTTTSLGTTFSVKGTIYYPAEDDGTNVDFNARLRATGRVPIVVMAHGNHDPADPSHLGYDYFQQQLARMGIVAASVFLNETNGPTGGAGNIRNRADLIIATLAHFKALDAGGPIFAGTIDFSRVGLMGHSRGGEAVALVPDIITLPGVAIRAVLALAPTDWGATPIRPRGYAYQTILPAGDGDVWSNDGAKFYDQALAEPIKSQVYVDNANHNFFNRHWLSDDANGVIPLLTRGDHERILSAYGCAFFRALLRGDATTGFLEGRVTPSGVPVSKVHLSHEREKALTVDNVEDGNGIGLNSLGAANSLSGGITANEHGFGQGAPAAFNGSFFGRSTGIVALNKEPGSGAIRFALTGSTSLAGTEVWIRIAEVVQSAALPATAHGFELGLEDSGGTVVFVNSDDVGGVPRPFDRSPFPPSKSQTKTMLSTLRFPPGCFTRPGSKLAIDKVMAIRVRLNRPDRRPLAIDDLQVVTR
jgi:dienelactone hydrolase